MAFSIDTDFWHAGWCDISCDLNYNEPDLNADHQLPQWSSTMSNARRGAAKPPDPFQCCMKLLDSVEMCKKASEVVSETMEQVSANLEPSPQSRSIYKNLEKVLEALATVQKTVDTCVTGVTPQSADVRYTHASLRTKGKRKATQEALRMEPLKKTRTSKPFKELDSMINGSVKTPSVPRREKSKRLASNLITPKSNVPIPTPADGAMFGVIELMKALESCPKGKMKEWYSHWIQMKYVPHFLRANH